MIYEDLKGKKVLVTGSSSGIGQATAILFAKQGCFVGVHYFQTKEGGEKTLKEVKKFSDGMLLRADVRSEKQVNNMVERFAKAPSLAFARKRGGGIDILINNAGTMVGRQTFESATLEFHEDVFATNARSVFLVTKAALGYLKKSKGCIVNIGSIVAYNGGAGGSGIYAGAKAAVHTETIAMAAEFRKIQNPSQLRRAGPYRDPLPPAIQHSRTPKGRRRPDAAGKERHRRRRRKGHPVFIVQRGCIIYHRRLPVRQWRLAYEAVNTKTIY